MNTPSWHSRIIVLEGLDGSGKTTTARLIEQHLATRGHRVAYLRDPGTTALGDVMRDLLLNRKDIVLDPEQLTLLFAASARALIKMAHTLALGGCYVVLDRCYISSMAYRYADGIPFEDLHAFMVRWVPLIPAQRILYLSAPAEVRLARLAKAGDRGLDRFESRPQEYFDRVAAGYELIQSLGLVQTVDATQTPDGLALHVMAQYFGMYPKA